VLVLPTDDGSPGVKLSQLLTELGNRGIASALVEGGAALITSLLVARLADRLVAIVAPKLIGRGLDGIGELGISDLKDAITFASMKTRRFGADVVFDGRF
jgi:riboflavin biosynthesis pyrimidine reductase